MSTFGEPSYGSLPVRKYNQRMAQRVARRAHLDEQAVAVAFTFNNLFTMLTLGVIVDIVKFVPIIGASAAIMGVMVGFAMYWPREKVYIWGVLPVEAWLLVGAYVIFDLVGFGAKLRCMCGSATLMDRDIQRLQQRAQHY